MLFEAGIVQDEIQPIFLSVPLFGLVSPFSQFLTPSCDIYWLIFFDYCTEAMVYFYEEDNQTLVPRTPYLANFGGSPSVVTIMPSIGATNIFSKWVFLPNPNEYPFDRQFLEMSFEDIDATPASELEFYWLESMSGVSDQVRLRGWSWDKDSIGKGITRVRTYFGSKKVSQFTWTLEIVRARVVAVQVLLPPFFVLVSVLISFIMPITASITRIGIVGSALISQVSLHSGFKSANGTAGSLGLIDWFFILTYLILVISLSINVLVMILLRKNPLSPLATYLESRTKYFVWLVCPGLYTFIFFRGKLVWAAVICLVTPLIIYAILERIIPKVRAFSRKIRTVQKKRKEDAVFGDEELEAKLQDDEGFTEGTGDSRKTAVEKEITLKRKHLKTNSVDSTSANLYDTDSE